MEWRSCNRSPLLAEPAMDGGKNDLRAYADRRGKWHGDRDPPDKLNATNRQLSSELHEAVKQMDANEAIGCIVITGAGDRAFSAGGDIHEQREDDRRYTQEELDAHRRPSSCG